LRQSLKELREKMDDEREQALEEARLVNKFSQFIANFPEFKFGANTFISSKGKRTY